ncbi:hypothetical protein VNO78_05134 [Psophocarpus tetragonolobus]|uniref:Uncharacterized protein n=1 Tax=Psophocarpus tetragonolobus TaxID=3891 RepID=A0AAN9XQ90_PSOTE
MWKVWKRVWKPYKLELSNYEWMSGGSRGKRHGGIGRVKLKKLDLEGKQVGPKEHGVDHQIVSSHRTNNPHLGMHRPINDDMDGKEVCFSVDHDGETEVGHASFGGNLELNHMALDIED